MSETTEESVIDIPVAGHKCPICGCEAVQRYKPFCSKRCADIDLNRWFTGVYNIPAEPVDPEKLPTKEEE
ncbi:MAG: DNA gyrase inhibitor YacG [Alphaproteobacteria bacterium]|nr:DNA gyrase inhibitor YacG [Alphaproteobacteria bacterium]